MMGGNTEFTGFSAEGLALLAQLGTYDKDRYRAEKAEVDRLLIAPAKAFAAALLPALQEVIGPELDGAIKLGGSISPLHNDLRFHKNKPPYKDALTFRFWEGHPKNLAPTVGLRLSATDIGFATWVGWDKAGLARFRERVAGPEGAALEAAAAPLEAKAGFELAGNQLKRVPKPWTAEHPRERWLRLNKGAQLRWLEALPLDAAGGISGEALVALCVERLGECAPVHRWFVG